MRRSLLGQRDLSNGSEHRKPEPLVCARDLRPSDTSSAGKPDDTAQGAEEELRYTTPVSPETSSVPFCHQTPALPTLVGPSTGSYGADLPGRRRTPRKGGVTYGLNSVPGARSIPHVSRDLKSGMTE